MFWDTVWRGSGRAIRAALAGAAAGLVALAAGASPDLDPTASNAQMEATLSGPGITITPGSLSVTAGQPRQYGTFTDGDLPSGPGPVVGIDRGVFMATADAVGTRASGVVDGYGFTGTLNAVTGPNDAPGISSVVGTSVSDPQLTSIASNATFDPVILQLEATPSGAFMKFSFVFGSDEYPEYVCTIFNDAFGFFIREKGTSTWTNAALVPGSSAPIAVNTINNGSCGFQYNPVRDAAATRDLTNASNYVNNGEGTTPASNANLQYDGFTIPFVVDTPVTPGATYEIKLAIADAGDAWFDSAVFLKWISSSDFVQDADIEIDLAVDDANPTGGDSVTFTLDVTNTGQDPASGAQVAFPLPAGFSWVSDTSGGNYNPATGIWTVPGTLTATGGTQSIDIVATSGGSGAVDAFAELSVLAANDVDSTPGNGAAPTPAEDDEAVVTLTVAAPPEVTSFGTPDPAVTAYCARPGAYAQVPFDDNGQGSVSGVTVTTSKTQSTGVSLAEIWLPFDPGTAIFDESEHSPRTSGLGFNHVWYDDRSEVEGSDFSSNADDVDDVFTQVFGGRDVYDVYIHLNSIDHLGFFFDPAVNPDLGWEIVSRNDDGVNIATGSTLFFVDEIEADFDQSVPDEQLGGNAGKSADGTIRLFSTNGAPISQIVWRFRADPPYPSGILGRNDRLQFAMEVCAGVDRSDLDTATYGEATHGVLGDLTIGATVDGDFAAISSPDATGDGSDDDGVTFPALVQGMAATISVEVTQVAASDGYLQGWIDWNGDGDFADAGEQVATDLQSATAGNSTINVPVNVPASATTSPTFARFRWSSTSGLDSTTAAPDGEVEDYALTIEPAGLSVSGRVFEDNGDGGATAHDGLFAGDEAGLGGVLVQALDAAGNPIAEAVTSDGDGLYTLTLPSSAAGTPVTLRAALAGGGWRYISGVPGDLPAPADTLATDGRVVFTPVPGTAYTGVDIGEVRDPQLAEPRQASVSPGQVVLLAHTFTAHTAGTVTLTLGNEQPEPAGAFVTRLIGDANCNGEADAGESAPPAGQAVAAGETVCLLVRVQADAGAPADARLGFDVLAAFSFAASAQTADLVNADRVTVSSAGSLILTKQVCNVTVSACDALSGTGFAASNTGAPGDRLVYRIVFEASGPEPVADVEVFDDTPAWSSLSASLPAIIRTPDGLVCSLVTPPAPAAGYTGAIGWTCTGAMAPGDTGIVAFEVAVDE